MNKRNEVNFFYFKVFTFFSGFKMSICQGITLKGNQCKIICKNDFCHIHNENCSICLENFKSKIKLNCSHKFCKLCIYNWMFTKNTCPMCRTLITDQKKFTEYAFKNKFYIKMKKNNIIISFLDKADLEILSLLGIYVNGYINQKVWEKIIINSFWTRLNINIITEPIEFIAKIIPEKYDFFKENNNVYFFI